MKSIFNLNEKFREYVKKDIKGFFVQNAIKNMEFQKIINVILVNNLGIIFA